MPVPGLRSAPLHRASSPQVVAAWRQDDPRQPAADLLLPSQTRPRTRLAREATPRRKGPLVPTRRHPISSWARFVGSGTRFVGSRTRLAGTGTRLVGRGTRLPRYGSCLAPREPPRPLTRPPAHPTPLPPPLESTLPTRPLFP